MEARSRTRSAREIIKHTRHSNYNEYPLDISKLGSLPLNELPLQVNMLLNSVLAVLQTPPSAAVADAIINTLATQSARFLFDQQIVIIQTAIKHPLLENLPVVTAYDRSRSPSPALFQTPERSTSPRIRENTESVSPKGPAKF